MSISFQEGRPLVEVRGFPERDICSLSRQMARVVGPPPLSPVDAAAAVVPPSPRKKILQSNMDLEMQ